MAHFTRRFPAYLVRRLCYAPELIRVGVTPDLLAANSNSYRNFTSQITAMPPKRKAVKEAVVDFSDSDSEPEQKKKRVKRAPRKKAGKTKDSPKKPAQASKDKSSDVSDVGSDTETKTQSKKGKGRPKKEIAPNSEPGTKTDNSKPDLSELDFDCNKTTKSGDKWNMKIATWNVAGLRACLKKDGLSYLKKEDPDIFCLQETKCPESKLPEEVKLPGYHMYWANGKKDGYAGVGLYSKEKPIKVTYGINDEEHDTEGRLITAEFEKFFLVTVYVPNSGQGLKTLDKRMSWDSLFRAYLKKLDETKPVILCGDLNVAHNEIDLANPKTNTKNAGFTIEERNGFTELLKQGFVDTYRSLYPDEKGAYTFWTYFSNARAKNTGWRLDYFVLSERLVPSVCDVVNRNKVFGSDHCPVTMFLHV